MPRLQPSLLRYARLRHPLLPRLLRECRDLNSAQNELRWLKEHAHTVVSPHSSISTDNAQRRQELVARHLISYVNRRAEGEPLQYILGTQPFGTLEILCRKGVLIPRPDTETYVTKAATIIHQIHSAKASTKLTTNDQPLRILDLCTGTGCISLLLHSLLHPPSESTKTTPSPPKISKIQITGIDISSAAIALAKENLTHNMQNSSLHPCATDQISFHKGDIFALSNCTRTTLQTLFFPSTTTSTEPFTCDIVISNPPYISPSAYNLGGTTERSVRKYEPRLALVPATPLHLLASTTTTSRAPKVTADGDTFYPHICRIADTVAAKLIIMEVADTEQARRVVRMIGAEFERRDADELVVEVWFDDGEVIRGEALMDEVSEGKRGMVSARAVVCFRGGWARWRRGNMKEEEE